MAQYHPPELELEPLEQGRMLVLSAFPERVQRTTRETSLARNRLVLALATDLIIPHISPNGGLAAVMAEMRPDRSETPVSLTS
jgi:predicted Rossmann fold nucleotide-binding protein DprA/Smf involved in DNA uptake